MILGFLQCCTPASACNEPCQRVISHHVNKSCHTMSTSHLTRMNLSKHVWHWISFLRFASLHLCHMMRSHSFIHSRRALHVSNDDIFCRSHVTPALLLTYDMTHDIYIVTVVSRVTCSCVMSHLQESWHTCIATVMSHEAWLMTHEPWLMSHDSWAMDHDSWLIVTHDSWLMIHDSRLMTDCSVLHDMTRDSWHITTGFLNLWDIYLQPIADRVAQHLEITCEYFQFSTRRGRILMGFFIYYLVLIVNPMGRIVVRWKGF